MGKYGGGPAEGVRERPGISGFFVGIGKGKIRKASTYGMWSSVEDG